MSLRKAVYEKSSIQAPAHLQKSPKMLHLCLVCVIIYLMHTCSRYIAIDGSQSATMPQHLGRVTEGERVQAIWRATILGDADADVDPLIQDLHKIAFRPQSGKAPVAS